MSAGADEVVFCDSAQLMPRGNGNFTLPKFDSNLGELVEVEIALNLNLSQQVQAENTDEGNSTVNSTIESLLTLPLPNAQEIKANASLVILRDLEPFDGEVDFAGSSGMDITESSSSGREIYSSQDISGFVAEMPGEKLLLQSVLESKPSMNITGSASSQVQTKTGASVCVSYRYNAGESDW